MTRPVSSSHAVPEMTCQQVIALLGDYLDSTLGPGVLEALERHLGDCAPCLAYLNTYRRTRAITAAVEDVPMPEEVRARLQAFVLAEQRRARD